MTAQVSETLIYKGEELSLCSEPLESHFRTMTPPPVFRRNASCCWRGYIGTWEISEGKLYLTEITAWDLKEVNGSYTSVKCAPTLEDGTEVTIASLFPASDRERVFANWFTGTLRCPQGERLKYVHGGYGRKYERDLFIKVERGVVISELVTENTEDIQPEQLKILKNGSGLDFLDIPDFLRRQTD